MTKQTIEKIIRNNRPGFAAHQIWAAFQKDKQQSKNKKFENIDCEDVMSNEYEEGDWGDKDR